MIGDDWIADALGGRDFGMESIFFDVYKEDKKEVGLKAITIFSRLKNICKH
jgi:putative hydrolase of the HAD superfamily